MMMIIMCSSEQPTLTRILGLVERNEIRRKLKSSSASHLLLQPNIRDPAIQTKRNSFCCVGASDSFTAMWCFAYLNDLDSWYSFSGCANIKIKWNNQEGGEGGTRDFALGAINQREDNKAEWCGAANGLKIEEWKKRQTMKRKLRRVWKWTRKLHEEFEKKMENSCGLITGVVVVGVRGPGDHFWRCKRLYL